MVFFVAEMPHDVAVALVSFLLLQIALAASCLWSLVSRALLASAVLLAVDLMLLNSWMLSCCCFAVGLGH